MTVGELREAIKDIDDNVEVEVFNPYEPYNHGYLKDVVCEPHQPMLLEFW